MLKNFDLIYFYVKHFLHTLHLKIVYQLWQSTCQCVKSIGEQFEIIWIFKVDYLKFRKGHKTLRHLPHGFDIYLVNVKTIKKMAQIFVTFLEKLNFIKSNLDFIKKATKDQRIMFFMLVQKDSNVFLWFQSLIYTM